jgi:NAD(P)-dependent dehydrogenase (short-subunit alcohol dehydrogenase family)
MAPIADFSLQDRVAIVTGSSRGIGEAIARGFAEQGAHVVIVSRKQEGVDAVAESIRADGGQATAIACHVGKPDAIAALMDRVESDQGRIDVLVNNAATNPYFGPAVGITEAAFDKTFEVNVRGAFLLAQRAAKSMVKQGGGSIINIASIAGISPPPLQGVYAMTKASLIMMTKVLAKELGSTGVRCNAIAPGLVETQFASVLIENPKLLELFTKQTPLNRHGQPNELVGAAVYLASDASSYTTGAVLPVDGGYTT